MLTLSFATRTDSTADPLIQRVLAMAMEFNDLTGTCRAVLGPRVLTDDGHRASLEPRGLY